MPLFPDKVIVSFGTVAMFLSDFVSQPSDLLVRQEALLQVTRSSALFLQ